MGNGVPSDAELRELIAKGSFRRQVSEVSDQLDRKTVEKSNELANELGAWRTPWLGEFGDLFVRLAAEAVERGLVQLPRSRPQPPDPAGQYVPGEDEEPAERGPDGFPLYADDPHAEAHRLLGRLMLEGQGQRNVPDRGSRRTELFPSLDEVDSTKGPRRAVLMVAAVRRWMWIEWRLKSFEADLKFASAEALRSHWAVCVAVDDTLTRGTTPSPDQLAEVVNHRIGPQSRSLDYHCWEDDKLLRIAGRTIRDHGMTDELATALHGWQERLEKTGEASAVRKKKRIAMIAEWIGAKKLFDLVAGEAWSDRALDDLGKLPADEQRSWSQLLEHAGTTDGARPKAKWSKAAAEILDEIGRERVAEIIGPWFELSTKPRTKPIRQVLRQWIDPNLMLNEVNLEYLKGLAWLAGVSERAELAVPLRELAMSGLKKVPNVGPRAVRLSNAAIWALSQLPGTGGVAQLAVLKSRVTHRPTLKTIGKAYDRTAEREGILAEDLEEMAVPGYGLTEVGQRRAQLGEFTAELIVTGTTTTELRWQKPDGRAQKTVPKAVKENQPDELRAMKADAKEIVKMLSAQRDRLDRMALNRKSWPYAAWAERYLNHPLMGTLSRRLVWSFSQAEQLIEAAWLDGRLVDADAKPVIIEENAATVALWHPLVSEPGRIVAWRQFFERREISQPFKQAHREVYLLTDAERATEVYSNRFAAHILRQHQFNVLAKQRGWTYSLQGAWDGIDNRARRVLPEWDLVAEFWADAAGDYDEDTTASGIMQYVSTDQVRFYHAGDEAELIRMAEVPPIVLSEVMRDVDLFVGVASVGNDPEWQDGGPEGRYRDYWHSYSFGDLSSNAQTRKELLERIVPRLKIADRCTFDDKFLVVRGDLRTYKIHLGSGNILMMPGSQYLCIVPGRTFGKKGPAGKVFLPFEGDPLVAVVLSKAFLLADDKKITDTTITNQIRG